MLLTHRLAEFADRRAKLILKPILGANCIEQLFAHFI